MYQSNLLDQLYRSNDHWNHDQVLQMPPPNGMLDNHHVESTCSIAPINSSLQIKLAFHFLKCLEPFKFVVSNVEGDEFVAVYSTAHVGSWRMMFNLAKLMRIFNIPVMHVMSINRSVVCKREKYMTKIIRILLYFLTCTLTSYPILEINTMKILV